MILHLHTDSRFTDYVIDLFDESEIPQHHLIGIRYPGQPLKAVTRATEVQRFVFGFHSPKKVIEKLQPSAVVIHFFDKRWISLVESLKEGIPVVWIFWGGDGYSLPKLKEGLLDARTKEFVEQTPKQTGFKKLLAELNSPSIWRWSVGMSLLFELSRRWFFESQMSFQKALERVDYCGTFLKEDYDLLRTNYPVKMKWLDICFISVDRLIKEKNFSEGGNVLIGNSCTVENNHLDCFEQLREREISGQVICPLNYGKDLGNYQKEVIRKGEEVFGADFQPLTDPLPLQRYNQILGTCSHAIFYHNRQQAFNSILVLLYSGVKVFLKSDNTIYQFMKRIGCELFSVTDLDVEGAFEGLDRGLAKKNRKILTERFGKERIKGSLRLIEQTARNL